MTFERRHLGSVLFVLAACISVVCSSFALASSAKNGKVQEEVQICDESKGNIQLELSRTTPEAKFSCEGRTSILSPPTEQEYSDSCFTDEACTKTGSLSALLKGRAYVRPVAGGHHVVRTTGFPAADTTVYFLCSNGVSDEKLLQKCTVAVTVKGSARIGGDRQCKTVGGTVNMRLTAPTEDATFTCGGDMTTLAPDSAENVYNDQNCSVEAKLATVIPKATLARGVNLGAHTLSVPALPQKTTTLCYKCQNSANTDVCKVIITIDSASATATTTAPTSEAASVVAEAGGHVILWVAALCTTVLYGR